MTKNGKRMIGLSHRRNFGNYSIKYGNTQRELIRMYHFDMKKSVDEIQELINCPRPSIRARIHEIKNGR